MHRRHGLFFNLFRNDAFTGAQLGELGAQRLELCLRRIVAVERLAGVVCGGELVEHIGGFRRLQVELNVGGDAGEMDAAGSGPGGRMSGPKL